MQDRFKFRVFISDKKNSKNSLTGMFKVHSLHTGTNKAIITSLYGNCSIKLENNILMQCTGLKDKNGKLIYEGDIVRYKDEVYNLCIGRIEWDNAHYELQYYTGGNYGWFSHILCIKHIKNIEVIGNRYENPDLLEVGKKAI